MLDTEVDRDTDTGKKNAILIVCIRYYLIDVSFSIIKEKLWVAQEARESGEKVTLQLWWGNYQAGGSGLCCCITNRGGGG